MNIDRWEEKIIAYVEGDLQGTEKESVETAIAEREDLQKLYDFYKSMGEDMACQAIHMPSQNNRSRFDAMIDQEEKKLNATTPIQKSGTFSWKVFSQIAAAIVLVLGAGLYMHTAQEKEDVHTHLAEVNAKMDKLMNERSPTERIRAITVTYTGDNQVVNTDMIRTLIHVMKNDESSHVRLTAVESIAQYIEQDDVRAALVRALGKEKDAAVQLAIIQAIAMKGDKKSKHILEDIIKNEGSEPHLIDEASMQLKHLINI